MHKFYTGVLLVFLLANACSPKLDKAFQKLNAKNHIEGFLGCLEEGNTSQAAMAFDSDSSACLIFPGCTDRNKNQPEASLLAFTKNYQQIHFDIEELMLEIPTESRGMVLFAALLTFEYESEGFGGSMKFVPMTGLIRTGNDGHTSFVQVHMSIPVQY